MVRNTVTLKGGGGPGGPGGLGLNLNIFFYDKGPTPSIFYPPLNLPHTSLYALSNLLASKNSRGLLSLNSFLKTVALKKLNYSMFK